MVEDEVGDLSGVAEDVVLDFQVVECVVHLSTDVLATGGSAAASAQDRIEQWMGSGFGTTSTWGSGSILNDLYF